MENKNNTIGIVAVGIVGVLIGWLIWGGTTSPRGDERNTTHMMPDGTMMGGAMDMESMMASMNTALAGKSGDVFDEAFIDEMIIHHQGAIDMARLALVNAQHQEIKTLAGEIIAAQTKEIAQMKEWKKNWYNQ